MSFKKQAISGVKWTSFSTAVLALGALLKISVLARYLAPKDFGLMALITFLLGFMDLFMDMGITTAILHKQNISRREYASLYWLNLGFSIVLFASIVVSSPLIASFYEQSELLTLIPLSGSIIIISAIGRQHKTIFQKLLKFKLMAVVDMVSMAISLIIAIVLAVYGYGVYALVYSAILQFGINNGAYFILGISKNPVLFHYNYKETKPFLKIGMYQVGGQVINYFNRDLDVLIIGKFFGADILGGYSLAKQLVRRPQSIINPIINRVAMSILPRYQSNEVLLLVYFNKMINKLSIINGFVYGVIAIAAPLLVSLLYGNDYSHIVVLVQLFTMMMYFRSVSSLVGILSITKGRTDIEFYWNIMIAVVMPLAMFIGINKSTEIIVLILGITQMLLVFPMWYVFYHKQLNMPLLGLVKSIFMPFIIFGSVFIVYLFLNIDGILFQILGSVFLLSLMSWYTLHYDEDTLKMIKSNKFIKRLQKSNKTS